MKRLLVCYSLVLLMAVSIGCTQTVTYNPEDYDYGDYSSETLVAKAWSALQEEDLKAVLAYTDKCLELYEEDAREMQAKLTSYPKGKKEEIFVNWWALNDVATSLYIQGESYEKAGMKSQARQSFQKLMSEYSFGQCWDPKGWFWKPVDAARKKMRKY